MDKKANKNTAERYRITNVGNGSLNTEDRVAIAQLLVKAGYTVRLGKDKVPGKNTVYHFVEYWEED